MNHVLNFNKWAKLNEDATSLPLNAQQIVDKIGAAMDNGNFLGWGTDDTSLYKVIVGKINNSNYQQVLALVKKKGYNTICGWISQDVQHHSANSFEEFFDKENEKIVYGIERHLQQFNKSEKIGTDSYYGSGKDAGGSRQGTGAETVRKITGQ